MIKNYPVCQHPVVRGMICFSVNGSMEQTIERNAITIVGATPATELGADDPNLIHYTFRVDLTAFNVGDVLEITMPSNVEYIDFCRMDDFGVHYYFNDGITDSITGAIYVTFLSVVNIDCYNVVYANEDPAVIQIRMKEPLLERLDYFDIRISEDFIPCGL